MNILFKITYEVLMWLPWATALTYREINIVVYFMLIPFLFCYQLDKMLQSKWFRISFASCVVIGLFWIDNFEKFSYRLFDLCVVFLNSFDFLGWNYVEASVMIYVVLTLLIVIGLYAIERFKLSKRTQTIASE